MDNIYMDEFEEDTEVVEDCSDHVVRADAVIDRNSGGLEPIENWSTSDLVELASCLDIELQARSYEREPSGNC